MKDQLIAAGLGGGIATLFTLGHTLLHLFGWAHGF